MVKTVDDNLVALIAKIGEKITIGKAKTISNSLQQIINIYIQL